MHSGRQKFGKIFCMGDIHGFYREFYKRIGQLGDLHTVTGEGARDRLILLGDYIDGGPDNRKVLGLIRSLQIASPAHIVVLRGNHEEMLLDWLDTYAGEPDEDGLIPWNSWLNTDPDFQTFRSLVSQAQWDSFRKALPSMSETAANMEAAQMVLAANRELIDWLRGLPYYYETEIQIFVHAGVDEEAGEDWKWGISEASKELWNSYGLKPQSLFGNRSVRTICSVMGLGLLHSNFNFDPPR